MPLYIEKYFHTHVCFSGTSNCLHLWQKSATSSSARRHRNRSLRHFARGATPCSSNSCRRLSWSICSARPARGLAKLSPQFPSRARLSRSETSAVAVTEAATTSFHPCRHSPAVISQRQGERRSQDRGLGAVDDGRGRTVANPTRALIRTGVEVQAGLQAGAMNSREHEAGGNRGRQKTRRGRSGLVFRGWSCRVRPLAWNRGMVIGIQAGIHHDQRSG